MKRTPYPGCPAEETLQELAAGICDPDIAETTTEHAAHCDYCGPVLSRYVKEFSDDLPGEDAAILAELKTATPRWQKKFVEENSPQPKKSWFTFWPKLVTGAATAAAAVGGYLFLVPNDLRQAQQLVASSYGERRTTEMRFPSAPSAAFQPAPVERGGNNGADWTSDSAPLHQAEAILLNKKRKSGELSPEWLEVEGRIDLLQARPSSVKKATEAFEHAHGKDPGNLNLKIDLAAAYFEGEMQAAPEHPDLENTIDLLNQVLKDPKTDNQQRSTALFDLAIAYQESNMRDFAIATWEHYLEVDPTGPWSNEARARLQKLKETKPDPKLQSFVNSRDPTFFLANFSNPIVQHNIEEYQETALTAWLTPQDSQTDSWQAAAKVAELLEKQHSDFWLSDLLSTTKVNDLQAVQALGSAIAANQQGLYEYALSRSSVAMKAFAARRNTAGELRARFEEVYALRSMLRGHDCLAKAVPLEKRLSGSKYLWLQAQLFLEQAQCQNFLGERADLERNLEATLNLARRAEFKVLELRIKGISVGIQHQQGRCHEAWTNSVDGIRDYWSEAYPAVRLGQFYDVLWQCALGSGYSYTAEALLRHTLEIRKSTDIKKNEVREGMIHIYLAGILSGRGDVSGAEGERNAGMTLLSQVSEDYSQAYKVVANIEPAERELQQENAELALATLKPLEGMLKATQDDFFSLRFYRLLGNIYLRLKRLDEASSAYQSAIEMAEASLRGLSTGRDRLDWVRATSDSYRGLVRVLLEQKKPEEALLRWEWYRSRSLLNGPPNSDFDLPSGSSRGWVQEATFRHALPHASQARIIYASFEDGLQIWLYKGGRVHSRWVGIKQKELQHSAEEFTRQCSTPGSDLHALQDLGQSLYEMLLQPIMSELPEKGTLMVELDYPAADLSLGALRDTSNRYIEDRYSITYSPGIWMENNLRSTGPIGTHSSLLLVDASHSPEGGTLPGASLERKTISELFAHTTVVNPENTKWDNWRATLAATEVFVFLGHGKPDGSGTVLVLNSQESLEAKDFTPGLLAHAKLAVLSACSTGVGKEDGPLDTDNLVHAFLSAGVPNVIASHWNVDSSTTAKLMGNFYLHLQKEETVVQAMADAQRTMLHEIPHPYYWASFTLTGKAN